VHADGFSFGYEDEDDDSDGDAATRGREGREEGGKEEERGGVRYGQTVRGRGEGEREEGERGERGRAGVYYGQTFIGGERQEEGEGEASLQDADRSILPPPPPPATDNAGSGSASPEQPIGGNGGGGRSGDDDEDYDASYVTFQNLRSFDDEQKATTAAYSAARRDEGRVGGSEGDSSKNPEP